MPRDRIALVCVLVLLAATTSLLTKFTTVATAAPVHDWSQRFGDSTVEHCKAVAVDPGDNLFIAGWYLGQIDLGGGPLVATSATGIFFGKFDSAGNHVWSTTYEGTGSAIVRALTTDVDGNLYAVGQFTNTVKLGGGVLTSGGGFDVFVAKYDTDGNHLWSQSFGGASSTADALDVAVGSGGDVLVSGVFTGQADFGTGTLASAGSNDIFLARYKSSGLPIWTKRFGGTGSDYGWAVDTDALGNILLGTQVGGSVDFGGGALPGGTTTAAIAKLDTNGAHVWSESFYAPVSGSAGCRQLAVGPSNEVVISGFFTGTVNFGGGDIVGTTTINLFVASYSALGAHQWSHGFGNTGTTLPTAMDLDPSGAVLVCGQFSGTASVGGASITSHGQTDMYLTKFDVNGVHQWSAAIGDASSELPGDMVVDGNDRVIAAGEFFNTTDLGGGPLVSAGAEDVYLASYFHIDPTPAPAVLQALQLRPNVPNPFNPVTTISFTLERAQSVELDVFDAAGRHVRSLLHGVAPAGENSVQWSGVDESGHASSSGVYFCRLVTEGRSLTRKMVLAK